MKYKLIAVDVDGTLLNSDDIITETTKEAIAACVAQGVIFTISTGRPIQGVRHLNQQLGLDSPFITYNGAMVILGNSRTVLYEQKLSADDASRIVRLGEAYGTTILVWADNRLFANELNERTRKYTEITSVTPNLVKDLTDVTANGVTKLLWYDEIETINRYSIEVLPFLSKNVNIHTSRPMFLEFVDIKASKAIAMAKIGQHYNIKQSEMIAVGDGFNDLSMIEYAGLGVAMGNADNEVKRIADYVTRSNDEDGVAHVINKFILNL
jgi:Cof subfamily protein (haloacid dehalogenase superfamily)